MEMQHYGLNVLINGKKIETLTVKHTTTIYKTHTLRIKTFVKNKDKITLTLFKTGNGKAILANGKITCSKVRHFK